MSRREFLWLFILIIVLTSCSDVSAAEIYNSSPYMLPWSTELGRKILVTQCQNQGNHIGLFAYACDFDFVGGEDMLASRAGFVSDVHEGESVCGGSSKSEYSNYVVIDHGDGQYSRYDHLGPDVLVKVGGYVQQGQLIGKAGNSGYTNCQISKGGGTHLHFQVQLTGTGYGQSIPVAFADVPGDGVPETGDWLTSANVTLGTIVQSNQPGSTSGSLIVGLPEGKISFNVFDWNGEEGISQDFVIYDLQTGSKKTFDDTTIGGSFINYDWSTDREKLIGISGGLTYMVFDSFEVIRIEPNLNFEFRNYSTESTWAYTPEGREEFVYFTCKMPNPNESSIVHYVAAICVTNLAGDKTTAIADPVDLVNPTEDFVEHGGHELVYLSPSVSWSGQYLAFVKAYWDEPNFVDTQLFVRAYDAGFWNFLELDTGEKDIHYPKVSPFGDMVAFLSGSSSAEIWLINTDGSNLRRLTQNKDAGESAGWFDWSPDGKWIVFERGSCPSAFYAPVDCTGEIWITNVETGQAVQVTNTPNVVEGNPAWLPWSPND